MKKKIFILVSAYKNKVRENMKSYCDFLINVLLELILNSKYKEYKIWYFQ